MLSEDNKEKTFGAFVRAKRIKAVITLREFAKKVGYDPSNWSKVERGIADPPIKREAIEIIASVLSLSKDDKSLLIDMAMVESIAPELKPPDDLLCKLPIILRTIRGNPITYDDLRKLYNILNKNCKGR